MLSFWFWSALATRFIKGRMSGGMQTAQMSGSKLNVLIGLIGVMHMVIHVRVGIMFMVVVVLKAGQMLMV